MVDKSQKQVTNSTNKMKESKRVISLPTQLNECFVDKRVNKFQEKYEIVRELGKGAFGRVYEVIYKPDNHRRALKVIRCNKASTYPSSTEINVLKQLDHPSILKLYEYYEVDDNFYLVTQLFEGRELFAEIVQEHPFTERKAADIMYEIMLALNYTHLKRIVHRDLKAENILVKKEKDIWHIKIIDWGLGTLMEGELARRCGTPQYVAPEVFNAKYTEKCDMWSVGVILYIMLLGEMPFKGSTPKETVRLVLKGQYPHNQRNWLKISDDAKDLIRKLLILNPNERLTSAEALKHPWFRANEAKRNEEPPQLDETLEKLRQLNLQNNLTIAAFNYINNFLTTERDKTSLKRIFCYLDRDFNGLLSKHELLLGYTKLYGQAVAKKIVQDIFMRLDVNHSGQLQYNQFVTFALVNQNNIKAQKLTQAFEMFDTDNDGKISCSEIKRLFKNTFSELNEYELQQLIREYDSNNDSGIDKQEFIQFLENTSKLLNSKEVARHHSDIIEPELEKSFNIQRCQSTHLVQDNEINIPKHSRSLEIDPEKINVQKDSSQNNAHSDESSKIETGQRRRGRPRKGQESPFKVEPSTRETRQSHKKT